jgi:hypothetical protein
MCLNPFSFTSNLIDKDRQKTFITLSIQMAADHLSFQKLIKNVLRKALEQFSIIVKYRQFTLIFVE